MAIDDFDEYLKQSEPQKREKGYAWQTAIGLQAVDGLKPSDYLLETARRDIEGEITIDEAEEESHPTTTQQVPNNFSTTTQQVFELIVAVGSKSMSVKEMMTSVGLKDRVNFLRNYLNPAIQENVLRLLYPDKPNHPRQKYLLTVKGLAILNNINKY